MSEKQKNKFSWMGLLFGPYYYGGYNQLGKGIVMALIGFIPLTLLFVHIYAGLKADKQLTVDGNFNWGKAILVLLVHMLITGVTMYLISKL